MCRNRKTNSQPRTEVAMMPIAMPSTAATDDHYIDVSGGSYEDPNPPTTNQTNNDIVYINVQVSSATGPGAAGGTENGNSGYERLNTRQSSEANHGSSPEDPPAYEDMQNRPVPHTASTL